MLPRDFFHHCPRCGAGPTPPPAAGAYECAGCGFRFFFNAAAAVAVFVHRPDGRWLFIRRAREPGKGRLAPPGGFVDLGETAEAAARREIREEVGVELAELRFVSSHPNAYHYREVTYPTLDLFFEAEVAPGSEPRALDDVASVGWFEAREVAPGELAFVSMQEAWGRILARRSAPGRS